MMLSNTNIILNLDFVQAALNNLKKLEDERVYCRHDLSHFFDVARICYILCLENGLNINKDVIYTAAILHDLGREEQIQNGIPHEEASYHLALKAFDHTDFSQSDRELILSAIKGHRSVSTDSDFPSLFSRADKLSRDCFNCKAYETCYWSEQKKNNELKY